MRKIIGTCLGMTALALVLANCGGAGEGDDFTLSSSSSGGSCGSYVDVIPSSIRSSAMADVQCSAYVANADGILQAAKGACAKGDIAGANSYYANYTKAADSAVSSVKLLCGGSGGPTLPGGNTGGANYNLFLCTTGSGVAVSRSCTTSSKPNSLGFGCNWYLAGSGLTSSQCQTESQKY